MTIAWGFCAVFAMNIVWQENAFLPFTFRFLKTLLAAALAPLFVSKYMFEHFCFK